MTQKEGVVPCRGKVEAVHPQGVVVVVEDHHRVGEVEEVDHHRETAVGEGVGDLHLDQGEEEVEGVEGHLDPGEGVVGVVEQDLEGVGVQEDHLK